MTLSHNATILVTGASGFVGGHVLKAFRRRFPQARIVATTVANDKSIANADASVTMDLEDPDSPSRVINEVRPAAVVHLAAQSTIGAAYADPMKTWRVNVIGTLQLAEATLRTCPKSPFVFASSAEVYGLSFLTARPMEEASPLAPANPYASAKAAADLAIGEMALRGLHSIRIRPFNQVGPGQSDAFAVAAFARQVARIEAGLQEPVIRVGNLDRWRDLLDVRDAAVAYAEALARADLLEPGIVINLASGQPKRMQDILNDLNRLAGTNPEIKADPGRTRAFDIERAVGDPSRARKLLDWTPQILWNRTLSDVLHDWRSRTASKPAVSIETQNSR